MSKRRIAVAFLTLLVGVPMPRPAVAEEKDPNKLFGMLASKIESLTPLPGNFKEDAKFKEFIKYTCQKGNFFKGVFGVCHSAEGAVCGFKKEAYVACSLLCGELAKGMPEAEGFATSQCVTKHGKDKWGFANHEGAVQWAKGALKTAPASLGPVQKLCPLVKKVADRLPPAVKEFAAACP